MKINLILLAAGYARRFGAQKLLAPVDGMPMYLVTLQKLEEIKKHQDDCRIYVVTAEPEVADYCREHHICCIRNEGEQNTGIASSIKAAVKKLLEEDVERRTAACDMFFTADQPFLCIQDAERFLNCYQLQGKKLGTMECKGQWRNPNIFDASFRKELSELPDDCGGKYILKKHPKEVYCFHTEEEEQFFDIDTKDDYDSLIHKNGNVSGKKS